MSNKKPKVCDWELPEHPDLKCQNDFHRGGKLGEGPNDIKVTVTGDGASVDITAKQKTVDLKVCDKCGSYYYAACKCCNTDKE